MGKQGYILQIENNSTFVIGKMPSSIYKEFKKALGYYCENAFWIRDFHKKEYEREQTPVAYQKMKMMEKWDGYMSEVCWGANSCSCYIRKKGMHFPTGLLRKAINFFKESNIPFALKDKREKPTDLDKLSLYMSNDFDVRDYQAEAVEKAKKQTRGIIKCATGGGKTAIGSKLIQEIAISPTVFYVNSKDLLVQAQSELSRFLKDENGDPVNVGIIGDGKCEIYDINVMMIQTAIRSVGEKYENFDEEDKVKITKEEKLIIEEKREKINSLIRNAKFIICDEVQHWASSSAKIISDYSLNAFYKIGLSATPYRGSGEDLVIEGAFGRQIIDISASYLIRKNILVKPKIRFVKAPQIKVKKHNYQAVYKEAIVENTERNKIITDLAKKFYENEGRVLILCQRVAHGKLLEKEIPGSKFMHGAWSSKKRKEWLEEIKQGKPSVTIATTVFDEGIDCKPLNCLILAGAGKSPTRALQRIGRIIRSYTYEENVPKTEAVVVDFIDEPELPNKRYDKKNNLTEQSRERYKIYKTEEEFEIAVYE